jgi:DNA-binding HxlR family transcriptional regulator
LNLYEDYAFVANGKKRKQIIIELIVPKRHSELKRNLHLHGNCVTRILKDLRRHGIIITHTDKYIKYELSEKGKVLRKLILNNNEKQNQKISFSNEGGV